MRHYERLTDDQLLGTELEIDDPGALDGMVDAIPEGDDEPYVEFSYDLRGSGRDEGFRCVHGHNHLAGVVMRKGEARYRLGWKCAETTLGLNFAAYKADFVSAVSRRKGLLKRRDVSERLNAVVAWVSSEFEKPTLAGYDMTCREMIDHMPFIWNAQWRVTGTRLPEPGGHESPAVVFEQAVNHLVASVGLLQKNSDADETWAKFMQWLPGFVKKLDDVVAPLEGLLTLLQPATLTALCAFANEHDNPQRRRYEAGLLSITYRRRKEIATVRLPANYRVPDRAKMLAMIEALNHGDDRRSLKYALELGFQPVEDLYNRQNVFGPFLLPDGQDVASATMPFSPCNYVGMGETIDPTASCDLNDLFSVMARPSAASSSDLINMLTTSVAAWSASALVSKTAIVDATGGGDAVELAYSGVAALTVALTTNPDLWKPVWMEFDIGPAAAGPQLTRFKMSLYQTLAPYTEHWVKFIYVQSVGTRRVRVGPFHPRVIPSGGFGVNISNAVSGDVGKFRIGRVFVYQAREPVSGNMHMGVQTFADVAAAPTGAVAGGGRLCSVGGAPKWILPDGTVKSFTLT